MDLESVADELYALPPGEFVAARGRHVAAARTAKEPALAKQIAALRKPTLAAWAGNLLVRSAPEQVDALRRLGEGLRTAQERLAGEQLRELTRQRNALVAELAREARRLAAEAGQPVGDAVQHEVETTLHAVLADPEAAGEWAAGHLAKPLKTRPGFPATASAAAPASAPASRPARKRHLKVVEDPAKARAAELARAREEARAAERRARDQEKALDRDEGARDKAQTRLDEAAARVAELTEKLRAAEEAESQAREALTRARRTAAATARTARESRRSADRAASELTTLETEPDS